MKLLLFFVLFSTQFAFAYPEMIRHGYVNCMTCHSTQQGGDLLNSYGKELSKEIFSRSDSLFKTDTEQKSDPYWRITTPDWLAVGSDVRLLQTLSESSAANKGRFMIMQVDIDTQAAMTDQVSAYLSIGRYEPTKPDAEWKDFIYVPRAWVQYFSNSDESTSQYSVRAGRFYPTYGVNIAEHTYVNRRYLDFNPGQERLAAEVAYSSENYQAVITSLFQRGQYQDYQSEKGYVIQLSKIFGGMARAGINIYRSKLSVAGAQQEKKIDGIYALIGWTHEISTLIQADKIYLPNGKTGFVDLIKLGYEYKKGIQFFATQEYYNSDTSLTDPHIEAYGIGIQYFPFTNFELFLTLKKHKDSSQLNEYQNVMWLIGHMYF